MPGKRKRVRDLFPLEIVMYFGGRRSAASPLDGRVPKISATSGWATYETESKYAIKSNDCGIVAYVYTDCSFL